MTRSPAVFVDRDNTLIEDPGFIDTPDQVRLLPRVAQAIRRFRSAGYRVVVVTNQSGVARGKFDENRLQTIHERLKELLRADGAEIDGIYYCPYLAGVEAVVEDYRRDSPLRKPHPGMLLQAAAELNLDLSHSWMVGDRGDDVLAGRRAGCRTILVGNGRPISSEQSAALDFRADSLSEAADIVERLRPAANSPTDSGSPELAILREIRDLLDRHVRHVRQVDFSIFKLAATLLQMFALVAGLWACLALFNHEAVEALARFGLAACLLLGSILASLAELKR